MTTSSSFRESEKSVDVEAVWEFVVSSSSNMTICGTSFSSSQAWDAQRQEPPFAFAHEFRDGIGHHAYELLQLLCLMFRWRTTSHITADISRSGGTRSPSEDSGTLNSTEKKKKLPMNDGDNIWNVGVPGPIGPMGPRIGEGDGPDDDNIWLHIPGPIGPIGQGPPIGPQGPPMGLRIGEGDGLVLGPDGDNIGLHIPGPIGPIGQGPPIEPQGPPMERRIMAGLHLFFGPDDNNIGNFLDVPGPIGPMGPRIGEGDGPDGDNIGLHIPGPIGPIGQGPPIGPQGPPMGLRIEAGDRLPFVLGPGGDNFGNWQIPGPIDVEVDP
ncbi:LOW QUALITY PROTEIN: hypothetical protein CRUP_015865 [Coryphaenoides rupestris]|nr:LOW QUALITY PROTEIN: hypothetical protein CRUP_015865 [Coryphaenoides rupestris]